MTRIFLYATHPTLVDHESQLFHNLGLDVYTAAWSTKTRSNWPSSEVYLNPLHFYKGECSFLDSQTIDILSKININMDGTGFDPKISDAIINNFDILYVSQITPWLMNYAPQFLAAGKHVLFRTFGYDLKAWGNPSDYRRLYNSDKFYIVPTLYKEINLKTFGNYNRVRLITVALLRELLNINSDTTTEKFITSVVQGSLSGEEYLKNYYKNFIDLRLINRNTKFIGLEEYDYLFNNCIFYIDFSEDYARYSTLEAMLRGKPTIVTKDKGANAYMLYHGFSCPVQYFHRGVGDVQSVKTFLENQNLLDNIKAHEEIWINYLVDKSRKDWLSLFEEIL